MQYIAGNPKIFMNFLNSIGPKDKVAITTHTDLDGIASAILMDEILRTRGVNLNSIDFIDYKKGMFEDVLEKLDPKTGKVFLLDINIDSDYDGFMKLKGKFDTFLIDHHPSQFNLQGNVIKTRTEDCATLAVYELTRYVTDLTRFKWLVCSTMISEMSYKAPENMQFISSIYPGITLENIHNSDPGELSKMVSSALVYFKGKERKVFDMVKENEIMKMEKYYEVVQEEVQRTFDRYKKNAEFYPDKNLYYYYYNPDFSISSIVTTLLSVEQPSKTFIFVSDADDNNKFVKVSSRNQSGREDLNSLLKKGIDGLENATAGGHVRASGAVLMKKDLKIFKENLLK